MRYTDVDYMNCSRISRQEPRGIVSVFFVLEDYFPLRSYAIYRA